MGDQQRRRPLPRPSPSAAQPPPAAPAAARPGRPLPRAVCGERAPPPLGAAPPPRPRLLARSAALGRRRRELRRVRLSSAAFGWARLSSATFGWARPGSAASKNSEEPRLFEGRRPAARGRSHPRAAAATQLAGRAPVPAPLVVRWGGDQPASRAGAGREEGRRSSWPWIFPGRGDGVGMGWGWGGEGARPNLL